MDPTNPNSAASWPGNPAFEDRPPHDAASGPPSHVGAARQGVERVKSAAAQALDAAADLLRSRAEGASGQVSALTDYGRQVSGFLSRSARYMDELDLDRVQRQLEDAVRRNPARSLLIAGAVGLVLGATLRRR